MRRILALMVLLLGLAGLSSMHGNPAIALPDTGSTLPSDVATWSEMQDRAVVRTKAKGPAAPEDTEPEGHSVAPARQPAHRLPSTPAPGNPLLRSAGTSANPARAPPAAS